MWERVATEMTGPQRGGARSSTVARARFVRAFISDLNHFVDGREVGVGLSGDSRGERLSRVVGQHSVWRRRHPMVSNAAGIQTRRLCATLERQLGQELSHVDDEFASGPMQLHGHVPTPKSHRAKPWTLGTPNVRNSHCLSLRLTAPFYVPKAFAFQSNEAYAASFAKGGARQP